MSAAAAVPLQLPLQKGRLFKCQRRKEKTVGCSPPPVSSSVECSCKGIHLSPLLFLARLTLHLPCMCVVYYYYTLSTRSGCSKEREMHLTSPPGPCQGRTAHRSGLAIPDLIDPKAAPLLPPPPSSYPPPFNAISRFDSHSQRRNKEGLLTAASFHLMIRIGSRWQ